MRQTTNRSRDCQIVRIEEDIQRNSTNTNLFFGVVRDGPSGRTPLPNKSSLLNSSSQVREPCRGRARAVLRRSSKCENISLDLNYQFFFLTSKNNPIIWHACHDPRRATPLTEFKCSTARWRRSKCWERGHKSAAWWNSATP